MSAIQPNNDFLNSGEKKEVKPIPKMEYPKDKSNNKVKIKPPPKEITTIKISKKELDIQKSKYPEYFALSDYQMNCLATTNYWRVMNGKPIIQVPELDKNYHKNFDNRCYELVKQKNKNVSLSDIKFGNNLSKQNPLVKNEEIKAIPEIETKKQLKKKSIKNNTEKKSTKSVSIENKSENTNDKNDKEQLSLF